MKSEELREGKVYFMCMYSLPHIPIPEITPYVFLYEEQGVYHFQLPKKYLLHQATKNISPEAYKEIELLVTQSDMVVYAEEDLELFSTYQGLSEFIAKLVDFENFSKWYI